MHNIYIHLVQFPYPIALFILLPLDHKVATSRQRSGSIGSPTADSKGSLLRARTIKALAVIEPILHGLGKTEIDLRKILEIGYIYI